MKENPGKYLDLPSVEKRKKAVEWCMLLLWLDIDLMLSPEFYDFVKEYESIVAYPEPIGFRFIFTDSEEELAARCNFKQYQKKAMELIDWFQKKQNEPGDWLKLDMKMTFTVKVMKDLTYRITDNKEANFEYSYARQIARLLEGKEFKNVFRKCPICGHYFVILSKHDKKCCNHKCSMLNVFKNKSEEDLKLNRRRNNLQAYFSRLKKEGWKPEKIRSLLEVYKKKKKYISPEIPEYIKKFIDHQG